ncbi:hypothetical protein AB0F81_14255 [Actinoplanes sp. NPDC024001]|uniref:hypothetical protein n=1 Tax=Actinoplanes sp. NPDC024001 TaxID=3154598 RepID=UPI0033EC8218
MAIVTGSVLGGVIALITNVVTAHWNWWLFAGLVILIGCAAGIALVVERAIPAAQHQRAELEEEASSSDDEPGGEAPWEKPAPEVENDDLPEAYVAAVIDAAVDMRRLGYEGIQTPELLAAAAPGYLEQPHRAKAPPDWCERALSAAATSARNGGPALVPTGDGTMGSFIGYVVRDKALETSKRHRRTVRPPSTVWEALIEHANEPRYRWRLAEAASARLLYRYAESLWQPLAEAGDLRARGYRDHLLIRRGQIDAVLASGVYGEIAEVVVRELSGSSREGELRRLAEENGEVARAYLQQLRRLHGIEGSESRLRRWAAQNYRWAQRAVADIDESRQPVDENRARARPQRRVLPLQVEAALASQDLDELITAMRTAYDDVDAVTGARAVAIMVDGGRRSDAMDILRRAADGRGHWWVDATQHLSTMLLEDHNEQELRSRADAGDNDAARGLADLLAEGRRFDELRERADQGSLSASRRLVEMLVSEQRFDELAAEVDAGTYSAAQAWVTALSGQRPAGKAEVLWNDQIDELWKYGLPCEYTATDINQNLIRMDQMLPRQRGR